MKTISFNVNDVLTSVANASMAVNPQITMPILKNLLIEVVEVSDTRYMLIVGSDGETWVRKKAQVSFDSDLCSFCVDAKKLLSILNDLKNDTIVFNIDEEKKMINAKYSKGKFAIPFVDAQEYISYKEPSSENNNILCFGETIKQGLRKLQHVLCKDTLRINLQCVHFDISTQGITMCGTDGFVLSEFFIENTDKSSGEDENISEFNLPPKPATILASLLEDGDLNIIYDEKTICFVSDNLMLVTRLPELKFPDYKKIIPLDNPKDVKVDKKSLINALKFVNNLGDDSNFVILDFDGDKINISARNIDFSTSATETIDAISSNIEGNFKIGFNSERLMTLIGTNIDDEDVTMKMSEPEKAILLFPSGNKEFRQLCMCTPMRIN